MSSRAGTLRDITVYPTEEKTGEDLLQRLIVEILRPLIEMWLAQRGVQALTGANQFIYFRRGDIRYRVAPDVFVLPGVQPDRRIRSWKTWEERSVPSFVLEVVSGDVDKDYIDAPALYRELGVRELIIFDPDFEDERDRFRFQVYRQVGKRGLVRVAVTNEDRVQSKVLGCWLRATGTVDATRLRLAVGAHGDDLVPTEAEYERAEKERERTEKEREHASRLALEAELQALKRTLGLTQSARTRKPTRR